MRPWRLVTRGAAYLAALLVCMVPLRPIGGRCEHASGKRGLWYWIVLACTSGRAWRRVTRGASSLAALLACMVFLRPFGGG